MRISRVQVQNFKRFSERVFEFQGDAVVSGPNGSGKTTLLQAIAAWSLALTRWWELGDYRKHRGAYAKAPITRPAFHPVPLRVFDLLWHKRKAKHPIVITVTFSLRAESQSVSVEILPDSTEQVYMRPSKDTAPDALRLSAQFPKPVLVPAMTGLSTYEPVYQPAKISHLLGQGKPGDALRNLLLEVNEDKAAWARLTAAIQDLFGHELLPPDADGPDIIAEYRHGGGDAVYDLASSGGGMLQVLMLLSFLYARPGSVLLLDEPDAHLHVLRQDGIYSELRNVARDNGSQLIIATHSEALIGAAAAQGLGVSLGGA